MCILLGGVQEGASKYLGVSAVIYVCACASRNAIRSASRRRVSALLASPEVIRWRFPQLQMQLTAHVTQNNRSDLSLPNMCAASSPMGWLNVFLEVFLSSGEVVIAFLLTSVTKLIRELRVEQHKDVQ